MVKLITDEYNKIESDLTISYKVPHSADNYIDIQMRSNNCPDSTKDDRDFICHDVKINEEKQFTADITLKPEICSLGLTSLNIDIYVFGQSDSELKLEIGLSEKSDF